MSKEARTLWSVVVLLVLALPVASRGYCGIEYSVVYPSRDSFMQHDTLALVIADCRNRMPETGIIADTFRIFDGLAHVSTPVAVGPTQSSIITFTGWVRDGLGNGPPSPQQPGGLDGSFLIHDQMTPTGFDGYSASAFDGNNYFVVWTHKTEYTHFSIMGARITQSGQMLDPEGIAVCELPFPGKDLAMPTVAYDGQGMYLVAWEDLRDGPILDVYGARVNTSGQVLDPGGFAICTTTGISCGCLSTGLRPTVAFWGDCFFASWVKMASNGFMSIFGSAVTRQGVVTNPDGVRIADIDNADQYGPTIAAGPGQYFVAWQWVNRDSPPLIEVHGAAITPNGSVIGAPFLISDPGGSDGPSAASPYVAFGSEGYAVVWLNLPAPGPLVHEWGVWGRMYSPSGGVGTGIFCIESPLAVGKDDDKPRVEFDGLTFLVVWADGRDHPNYADRDVYGKRLSNSGSVIEPEIPVCTGHREEEATVTHGVHNFLITWSHWWTYYGPAGVYGDLADATLISSNATYPSSGRHLARTPNQSDVDWVFSTNIGFFAQTRGDVLTLPPFYVGLGKEPTIAENGSQATWACDDSGGALRGYIRRADGTWRTTTICSADEIETPSLCISQISPMQPSPNTSDMGYVVYVRKPWTQNTDYICLAAFDSLGVYYSTVLDEGNNGQGVSSPCIALTPGDFLHVVWSKSSPGDPAVERVYYNGTGLVTPWSVRQGIQPVWWGAVAISKTQAEPATHCFVEAEGQNIYADWRGPFSTSNQTGEIWQKWGAMQPGGPPNWWLQLYNVSQTPNQESDYPSMSTSHAVVWQECLPSGYSAILARVVGQLVTLSNTTTNSYYPHANVLPSAPWPPGGSSRLTAVWTEQLPGTSSYDVPATDYYFPSSPGPNPPALVVMCGSALPSPYCLQRDGFDSTGLLPIDYAQTQLAYRLPYLSPQKYYLMEAVAYQRTATTAQEQFYLPNCGTWNLTVPRNIPETLRIVMPPGSHDSCATRLWITRIQGTRATLASVKLYEYEVVQQSDGAQSGKVNPLQVPKELVLEQSWPNPATRALSIRYGIPKMTSVSLNVYDIMGKLVRTLETNDKVKPGYYSINWNCRDSRDREVAGGIYFYRLVTSDMLQTPSGRPATNVQTRKLLIAR